MKTKSKSKSKKRKAKNRKAGHPGPIRITIEIDRRRPDLARLDEELVLMKGRVTAAEAARILGVGKDDLPRRLRELTKMNYRQYRVHVRIRTAADLLRDGRATVAEAADAVGYSARESLDRKFSRLRGVSPAKYRKSRAGFGS